MLWVYVFDEEILEGIVVGVKVRKSNIVYMVCCERMVKYRIWKCLEF